MPINIVKQRYITTLTLKFNIESLFLDDGSAVVQTSGSGPVC